MTWYRKGKILGVRGLVMDVGRVTVIVAVLVAKVTECSSDPNAAPVGKPAPQVPLKDDRPLCELVDGRSTCRCRPGLSDITIGGPLGRENIRVGNRTIEMRIYNCTNLHVYANGFEAAIRLRLFHLYNVAKLVLEPQSFAFPTNVNPNETDPEEKLISLRLHNIESDLMPESTFMGDFKIIEIIGSSFETWQTRAIGKTASIQTLRLNGTFIGVWERLGIDRTRTDAFELHQSDIDTLESEAVSDPDNIRDATIFGCRFRIINTCSFCFGPIWRLRFTNNTIDGSVKFQYVNATITGADVIVRNNKFAKISKHAFTGITAANQTTTLRFVGNLINDSEPEGLKFHEAFVPGTKSLNLTDTKFNGTCSPNLKQQVTSWAPEAGELMWNTGQCLQNGLFVLTLAVELNKMPPEGDNSSAATDKNFVNYVLPIIAGSSVAAVALAAGVAAFLCCGERRRQFMARRRGRRSTSGAVLTDSWNFGMSDSARSSTNTTRFESNRESQKSTHSGYPRYVFPVTETGTYNISEHVVSFETADAFEPNQPPIYEVYGMNSECEYAMAAPPLAQMPSVPRRMDTFSSTRSSFS